MIASITWHFFKKGVHLVTFVSGKEVMVTSAEIALDFNLGQLKRVGV